jgi:hypothetical protein
MGDTVRSTIDSWRVKKAAGGGNGHDSADAEPSYPKLYGSQYDVKKAESIRDSVMHEVEKMRDAELSRIESTEKRMAERGTLGEDDVRYLEKERQRAVAAYEALSSYHREYLRYEQTAEEINSKYKGGINLERLIRANYSTALSESGRKMFRDEAESFTKKRQGYIRIAKTKEWVKMDSHDGYKSYKATAVIDTKLPADLSGFKFIRGNTYPYKEELKKAGYIWDIGKSRWVKK